MPNAAPGRCEGSAKSGCPAMVKGMPKPGPSSGKPTETAAVEHAWHGLEAGEHLLVVRDDQFGILGACIGNGQSEGLDVNRVDAKVDAGEIPEAVNGEPGAGKQREGQSKFTDHEHFAHALTARARSERPPSLRASPGSTRVAYHAGAQPKSRPASVEAANVKSRMGRLRLRSASEGSVFGGMVATSQPQRPRLRRPRQELRRGMPAADSP